MCFQHFIKPNLRTNTIITTERTLLNQAVSMTTSSACAWFLNIQQSIEQRA
jgi:hypothetical protein